MTKHTERNRGLGELIAKWRRSVDMTQQELAVAVDVSISYIGKLEMGERIPAMDLLTHIVIILDEARARQFPDEPNFDLNLAYAYANYPQIAAPAWFADIVQTLRNIPTSDMPKFMQVLEVFSNEQDSSREKGHPPAVAPRAANHK